MEPEKVVVAEIKKHESFKQKHSMIQTQSMSDMRSEVDKEKEHEKEEMKKYGVRSLLNFIPSIAFLDVGAIPQ